MNPLPSGINPTGAPAVDPVALAQHRQTLAEKHDWLCRLLSNADVLRFFAVLDRRLKVTEIEAINIEKYPGEKLALFAQAHLELRTMRYWAERELESVDAQIKGLDEKQRGR